MVEKSFLAALVLAGGLAAAGWLAGEGFRASRATDRYVTVKGIAERQVEADLALWPMRFVATGDDLAKVQDRLSQDATTVTRFLTERGIKREEIELQSLDVTDLLAQAYRSGPVESRFIVAQTLMARTTDVARIVDASQQLEQLVEAGVILSSEMGPMGSGPYYLFTELTGLKPDMIAEATANARTAAEQFAADSQSHIGGIRRANQGLFQILPRDDAPQMVESRQLAKTVRVVSTIEYLLED